MKFAMDEHRAFARNIRLLKIAILNLSPIERETEVRFLRLLSNSPLQVNITLLRMEGSDFSDYLTPFYRFFDDIKNEKFDGMIISGTLTEHLDCEEIIYWPELCRIMDWTSTNVTSTFHVCWGAQAGLYFHYGIPNYHLKEKMFGVFPHTSEVLPECSANRKLLRGFDEVFYAPHSRHTEIRYSDIVKNPDLELISASEESGIYIVASKDTRRIFVTGHSEYDAFTLDNEYRRDLGKGLEIVPPKHYFTEDNPEKPPLIRWRAHANLIFTN